MRNENSVRLSCACSDPANWLAGWRVQGAPRLERIDRSGHAYSVPIDGLDALSPLPLLKPVDVDGDGIAEIDVGMGGALFAFRGQRIERIIAAPLERDVVRMVGSSGKKVRVHPDGAPLTPPRGSTKGAKRK